jgi:pantoate--beta-alanine ligase
MQVVDDPQQFRSFCDQARLDAQSARAAASHSALGAESAHALGLVLTMGALHAGHLSLVAEARQRARRVTLTVFVNPTQFAAGEDLAKYPRTLEADLALCQEAGVDLVFTPRDNTMYPEGDETRVSMQRLDKGLCGVSRPQHFTGVCTVVAKFLNLAGPCVAVFGKKDYQQFRVIERMVTDLFLPVQVVGAETHREADGLAMSSRNRYLSSDERQRAVAIVGALRQARKAFAAGDRSRTQLIERTLALLTTARAEVDYVDLVDARHLTSLDAVLPDTDVVLAIAAKFGRTRLIDNCRLDSADTLGALS